MKSNNYHPGTGHGIWNDLDTQYLFGRDLTIHTEIRGIIRQHEGQSILHPNMRDSAAKEIYSKL